MTEFINDFDMQEPECLFVAQKFFVIGGSSACLFSYSNSFRKCVLFDTVYEIMYRERGI